MSVNFSDFLIPIHRILKNDQFKQASEYDLQLLKIHVPYHGGN